MVLQLQHSKLLVIYEQTAITFVKAEESIFVRYMWCLEEGHGLLPIFGFSSVPVAEVELKWILHQGYVVVNVLHRANNVAVLWNAEWTIKKGTIPNC